jgi:hypothetical protein
MNDDDRIIAEISRGIGQEVSFKGGNFSLLSGKTRATQIWQSLRGLLPGYKINGFRIVKEDRIRRITASVKINIATRNPDAEKDYAREVLTRTIGEAIAERLLTFDKMIFIEYGDKNAPPGLQPTELCVVSQFEIIVPEGKLLDASER